MIRKWCDIEIDTLRKLTLFFALFCCVILSTKEASAQYYSWGADPASIKWQDIKSADVRIIYPDTVDAVARRTLLYINSIKSDVSFGFKYPALDIPFIMHTENFSSNGMVMWLPKRIEFLTTPATDSYSMLWTKQLVAHEYRHAVQYNNLNRGFVKWLSYILGEQGSSVGLLLLPLSIIEGDAVKCETSMSTFGRGLQPSFTMAYRAIGDEMLNKRNVDKWFCGSYLEFIPDHYHLGYQIVDYSYTHYKENIWNQVVEYSVRNPYVLATTSTSLKKYYKTNMAKLVRATFSDLLQYWDSIPQQSNTTELISPIDTTNYTTYQYPIVYNNSIIAIKSDYTDPQRIMLIDSKSGEEQKLKHTGFISTRPTVGGDRVWWSEYRQSMLYEQRVNSRLCYMDIESRRKYTVSGFNQTLYPTAIGDSERDLAYVEYAPSGVYTIVEMQATSDNIRSKDDFIEISRTPIPLPTEIHGLAWDDESNELYFIATDDSGMWIGARDKSSDMGYKQLSRGAYITISTLRAKGGVLYFGSIESGYDELHTYEISTGIERRISQSQYGSFDPSTPNDGEIYATTYNKYGYHLARQSLDSLSVEVSCASTTPKNIVNPERLKWDLINLDTVVYNSVDSIDSHKDHKSKRYHKGLNLIDIHSWLPASYNPFNLSSESQLNMSYGATLMSQNLLSSAEGYISYGYNSSEGSVLSGGFEYSGLGVSLSLEAKYGGDQVMYPGISGQEPSGKKHYSFTTGFTLPLTFDRGYHTRTLSVSSYWNYSNGSVLDIDNMEVDPNTNKILNYDQLSYFDGLHKVSFGIGFSDYVRSAHRDISTPFGYSLSASYAIVPSNNNFSDLISLYGKVVTRGLLPYNSLSVAGSYQTSIGGYELDGIKLLQFQSTNLLPQGYSSSDIVNSNYVATSLDYQFPLLYPEGGVGSILYLKRVRLNLGFDAAQFENYSGEIEGISSYGCDLIFDINALRLPEASTTAIKLSIYRLKSGTMSYQIGVDLPI